MIAEQVDRMDMMDTMDNMDADPPDIRHYSLVPKLLLGNPVGKLQLPVSSERLEKT